MAANANPVESAASQSSSSECSSSPPAAVCSTVECRSLQQPVGRAALVRSARMQSAQLRSRIENVRAIRLSDLQRLLAHQLDAFADRLRTHRVLLFCCSLPYFTINFSFSLYCLSFNDAYFQWVLTQGSAMVFH